MSSREDETYIALFNEMNVDTDTNRILREIAISLGRIADMLAELNGYHIEYDEEKNTEMQMKTVNNASEAATVDAVPVIRCKDCKWYEFDEPHRCGFGGHGVRGKSDYCSDAERKDNETD